MTTLDLNAYGVTEMSHAEKVDNDGGVAIPWGPIGVGLTLFIYFYDNWDDVKKGFKEGFEAKDNN